MPGCRGRSRDPGLGGVERRGEGAGGGAVLDLGEEGLQLLDAFGAAIALGAEAPAPAAAIGSARRGRRCSCGAPAEALEGDLVESLAFAAAGLALVLGALALLEALEDLVLARGAAELGVAVGDVGLVALELAHAHRALCLDVLDESLAREELRGADGGGLAAGGEALVVEGLLEVLLDAPQAIVAAGELGDGAGELLPREVLRTLAQRADALEAEAERGSGAHGRVIGRCGAVLEGLDRIIRNCLTWGRGTCRNAQDGQPTRAAHGGFAALRLA